MILIGCGKCVDQPVYCDDCVTKMGYPQPGNKKPGQGKIPMGILPFNALTLVAEVMSEGRGEHGLNDWRENPKPWSEHFNAALRHLFAWLCGQNNDPESGLSHLAHLATRILFLLEYTVVGLGLDDRFKYGGKAA